jgi:hypothetical protein
MNRMSRGGVFNTQHRYDHIASRCGWKDSGLGKKKGVIS